MNPIRTFWLVVFILLASGLSAQPYGHAAGIRAGVSTGITYKGFFLYSMSAVELDAFYNRHGLNISALYLMHMEPFRSERWLLYFGGGIFGGEWDDAFSLGLTITGGMEYTLRDLPLNFGVEWKPLLNLYRQFGYLLPDFGITIRYRFRF